MVSIYWMLLFSIRVLLSTGQECGLESREGITCTLSCSLADQSPGYMWQLQQGTDFVNISHCGSAGTCVDHMPESFRASPRQSVTQTDGAKYIENLIILRINRTQTSFKCVSRTDGQFKVFNLQVYENFKSFLTTDWLSTSGSNNGNIKLGLGVGLGFVSFVLVIVVITVIIRCNRRTTIYDRPNVVSDTFYHYASFSPGQQHPQLSASPFDEDHYDVIGLDTDLQETSMKVNQSSLNHEPIHFFYQDNELPDGYIHPI